MNSGRKKPKEGPAWVKKQRAAVQIKSGYSTIKEEHNRYQPLSKAVIFLLPDMKI